VHAASRFAIDRPLAFDATEGGEIGESRGVGGGRDHAGFAPLPPTMSAFDLLMRQGSLPPASAAAKALNPQAKSGPLLAFSFKA
jgi:hypothetical protein